MVYRYEVIKFRREFETEDDVEVVAAEMSAQGTRESSPQASNFALVRQQLDESYICGEELDSGDECGRSVDGPDERCWQHTDDDN